MGSPIPKHLRKKEEYVTIDRCFIDHIDDITVKPVKLKKSKHPAKYSPGLCKQLVRLANTQDIGDPMCGTGRLAEETKLIVALNEIDLKWKGLLNGFKKRGCTVTFVDAKYLNWVREVAIFSPPYYPRTDRIKNAAHNDLKRGKVVGYRTGYDCDAIGFVGDPGGIDGISFYRQEMTKIYQRLFDLGFKKLILVVKNTTRLGVELRLDLDTILMCKSAGWEIIDRHGWRPPLSLWQRYNLKNGSGVFVEDILVFERGYVSHVDVQAALLDCRFD